MDRKQITASIAGAGLVAASLFGAVVAASGSGDVKVVQSPPAVVATTTSEIPVAAVELTTADVGEPIAYEEDDQAEYEAYEEDEYEEYEEDDDHEEYEEDDDHDEYEEYEEDDDHEEYEDDDD